ncbi:unnamed protein product [Closterium sp. NIES-64]|nr:unnamed protein product [Closterium sp. NIES-64]
MHASFCKLAALVALTSPLSSSLHSSLPPLHSPVFSPPSSFPLSVPIYPLSTQQGSGGVMECTGSSCYPPNQPTAKSLTREWQWRGTWSAQAAAALHPTNPQLRGSGGRGGGQHFTRLGWEGRVSGWDGKGEYRAGMGREIIGLGWEERVSGWDGKGEYRAGLSETSPSGDEFPALLAAPLGGGRRFSGGSTTATITHSRTR